MTNHPFFLACSCHQIKCTEKAKTLSNTFFSEELELLPMHSINPRNSLVFSLLETKKSFMALSVSVFLDLLEQPYMRPLHQASPKLCSRQTSISTQLRPLLFLACWLGFPDWPWTWLVTSHFSNDHCPQPCSAHLAWCCGIAPLLARWLPLPMRGHPWLPDCLPWWSSPTLAAPSQRTPNIPP